MNRQSTFYTLLCLIMATGTTFGQTKVYKNVFVGPHLEYLEFRNDTSLVTTLNDEEWDTTTYNIRSDTLMIKKEHWDSRRGHWVEWRPYQLLNRQPDTIRMLVPSPEHGTTANTADTLVLVCLETLREPILSFTYYNITSENAFSGVTDITIDSSGRLVYYRKIRHPEYPAKKTTNQLSVRLLSKAEFNQFKNMLSYSLLARLRRFRGGCDAMDAGPTTIEIIYNGKKLISRGCTWRWPEALLYDLVDELANKKTHSHL